VPKTAKYATQRFAKFSLQMRHLPRALRLLWAVSRGLTIVWVVLLAVQGLLPTFIVYLTRAIVNALVLAIKSGGAWQYVRPTLVIAVLMGVVMLAKEIIGGFTTYIRTVQSANLRDYVAVLIQRKSVEVDLAFYDLSEFYDHLHRARIEANIRPVQLIEDLGALLQNGITVLAMIAIVIPYSAILPLAIAVATLPAFYVVIRAGLRRHEWALKATVDERRAWYYDSLLTEQENAAEIRLFGLADHFLDLFVRTRTQLRNEQARLSRRDAGAQFVAGLTSIATFAAAMAWMTWRAIRGLISIGDLALFYQAFNQSLSLSGVILGRVGQLYQNAIFLGNLFEFLDLQPKVASPEHPARFPVPIKTGILFDNVTFRYPGNDRETLREFRLEIVPGQSVAIVGPNGSGKSTLIKLLCRFYDVDAGGILIDGIPVTNFSLPDLRERISVFFQTPVHYNDTAAANIEFGEISKRQTLPAEEVLEAARVAGFDDVLKRLPDALDTHLGRRFLNGSELSVGEWQRLAVARALFRKAEILVLDEPTSAMDPWAELEWARRLPAIAAGRATLLITHRFTTAMFADVIHVMANGQIVESGSHAELVSRGGEYARAWASELVRPAPAR
jgi:ATP-binding cassette subfamily B protein